MIRMAWKRPDLPKDWVRVLERHPDGVVVQPGYFWLGMPGKVRHVWAAHLEVRSDEIRLAAPEADRRGWLSAHS
jgi:hypothetical protein